MSDANTIEKLRTLERLMTLQPMTRRDAEAFGIPRTSFLRYVTTLRRLGAIINEYNPGGKDLTVYSCQKNVFA